MFLVLIAMFKFFYILCLPKTPWKMINILFYSQKVRNMYKNTPFMAFESILCHMVIWSILICKFDEKIDALIVNSVCEATFYSICIRIM